MMRRDNDYDVQVYQDATMEADCPSLQRAFHAELCRVRSLHNDASLPLCRRALMVANRYEEDGRPHTLSEVIR